MKKCRDQLQNDHVVGDQNRETEMPIETEIEKEHATDRAQERERKDPNQGEDRQNRRDGRNRATEDIIRRRAENDQNRDNGLSSNILPRILSTLKITVT